MMKILNRRLLINSLFLVASIMLFVTIFFAYLQINKSLKTNAWVLHTYNVIVKANELIFTITEMESRISLLVLSNNNQSINDINTFKDSINNNLKELKDLTHDNPQQQIRINKLEPLIMEKINYGSEIMKVNSINNNEAKKMAGSERRRFVKNELFEVFSAFIKEELNLLNQRNDLYRSDVGIGVIVLMISFSIGTSILILSFILFNIYSKRITENEKQLSLINEKLNESDERYLLATEGSNTGLWDWKPWSNDVYYTPYFKKMLGYTDDEFPNTLKSFEDHLHPHDSNQLWKLVRLHLNDRVPYRIEYRLRTKSGVYRWFLAIGQAIWVNNEPVRMLGSITDITDKRNSEARLAAQYKIINILFSGTDMESAMTKVCQEIYKLIHWDIAAIWLYNEERKSLKCAYCWELTKGLEVFTKTTRQLELTLDVGLPGSVCKSNQPLFIPDIKENERFLRAQEANEAGLHSGYFIPITTKNNLYGLIEFFTCKREYQNDELLKMLFYIGYLVGDYIQRSQSAEKLSESEAYKTAVLNSALESIITIDKEGLILSYNPQTNHLFRYENEDLKRMKIDSIIPGFSELFLKSMDKTLIDCTGITRNHECFSAELVISKMNMKDQLVFVLIIRDISERKKIDKMKNEFISLVSHELRTPLTAIQASLDLILFNSVSYSLNEEVKELLEIATKNSERLIRLINDILDIEKIESGHMVFKLQHTDINNIVEESIKLNQGYAEKNHTRIVLINPAPNVYVNIDRDRIIQVLTNLMSNAVKFTPKDEEIDVSIAKIGSFVRVSVIDKGPGISEKFQAQIFHKFAQEDSTINRDKGGTGLGLSISRAIIKNMHGLINYTTSKKGTTFYFDLPVVKTEINTSNTNQSLLSEPK